MDAAACLFSSCKRSRRITSVVVWRRGFDVFFFLCFSDNSSPPGGESESVQIVLYMGGKRLCMGRNGGRGEGRDLLSV